MPAAATCAMRLTLGSAPSASPTRSARTVKRARAHVTEKMATTSSACVTARSALLGEPQDLHRRVHAAQREPQHQRAAEGVDGDVVVLPRGPLRRPGEVGQEQPPRQQAEDVARPRRPPRAPGTSRRRGTVRSSPASGCGRPGIGRRALRKVRPGRPARPDAPGSPSAVPRGRALSTPCPTDVLTPWRAQGTAFARTGYGRRARAVRRRGVASAGAPGSV